MTATLEIDYPATLLLHGRNAAALNERSRFLLALKYFALGELSSGQAAQMSRSLAMPKFFDQPTLCNASPIIGPSRAHQKRENPCARSSTAGRAAAVE